MAKIWFFQYNVNPTQAQEALFEKRLLGGLADATVPKLIDISGEASKVSEKYRLVESVMASDTQYAKFLPSSWTSMVQIKTNHYRALSHYFVAISLTPFFRLYFLLYRIPVKLFFHIIFKSMKFFKSENDLFSEILNWQSWFFNFSIDFKIFCFNNFQKTIISNLL